MKIPGIIGIMSTALLAACASIPEQPAATATLSARSGSNVSGSVGFAETSGGLKIRAKVAGTVFYDPENQRLSA